MKDGQKVPERPQQHSPRDCDYIRL